MIVVAGAICRFGIERGHAVLVDQLAAQHEKQREVRVSGCPVHIADDAAAPNVGVAVTVGILVELLRIFGKLLPCPGFVKRRRLNARRFEHALAVNDRSDVRAVVNAVDFPIHGTIIDKIREKVFKIALVHIIAQRSQPSILRKVLHPVEVCHQDIRRISGINRADKFGAGGDAFVGFDDDVDVRMHRLKFGQRILKPFLVLHARLGGDNQFGTGGKGLAARQREHQCDNQGQHFLH